MKLEFGSRAELEEIISARKLIDITAVENTGVGFEPCQLFAYDDGFIQWDETTKRATVFYI